MKFSINEYKGNGKYQVINGEYKKIGELIKRKSKEEKKRDDIIESIENTVEELKVFEEKEMKKQIALVDKKDKRGVLYNIIKSTLPIQKEYKGKISSLIKGALETESMHDVILYTTYDKKANKYYVDIYYEGDRVRESISKKDAEKVGIGMVCYVGKKHKMHEDYKGMTNVILGVWEQMLDEKITERNDVERQKRNNRLKNT